MATPQSVTEWDEKGNPVAPTLKAAPAQSQEWDEHGNPAGTPTAAPTEWDAQGRPSYVAQAPQTGGDVRPSNQEVMKAQQPSLYHQMVDPALAVGQQTLGALKDIYKMGMQPSGFSPEELQKGQDLYSALRVSSSPDSSNAGAYAGAAIRRTGQLANDALGLVSSPYNLATAHIAQHIQNVIQPWQDLALRMFGKSGGPDPSTGRYTTGNADIDKTIDTVVGAIPFMMVGEAAKDRPTPLQEKLEQLKGMPHAAREVVTQGDRSTPMGPISQTGGNDAPIKFAAQSPTEAHAPEVTSGATKSANVPAVDREALIAPKPSNFVGKDTPVPLYRFPKTTIEQMPRGETIGLDKVDLFKPRPPAVPEGPTQADLQNQIHGNIDIAAKLGKEIDSAESDDHAAKLTQQKQNLENLIGAHTALFMRGESPEALSGHVDDYSKRADKLDAQSKAIRDLTEDTIKNRGIKRDIADLRSPGGPPRYLKDETGAPVLDPETGKRLAGQPEEKVGRGARSVLDTLQGRVPTSDFNALQVAGKPEGVSDAEWGQYVSNLQKERFDLKKKISDAVQIAHDTGSSILDQGIEEHVDRLKEIEGLLGKYEEPAATGRRPNIAPQLDENGAIKAPEALASWTLDRARMALGNKVKDMPTDEEFFQHADMLGEKARLLRGVADAAQGRLDRLKNQAGFIGDRPALRGKVEPVKLGIDTDDFLKRARKATFEDGGKLDVRKVRPEDATGDSGFLVVDSKGDTHWIDNKVGDMNYATHSDIAEAAFPHLASKLSDRALDTVLSNRDIIRKARPGLYEVRDTGNSRALKVVELDAIKDRMTNERMEIDTRRPDGRIAALTIAPGWENLDRAIRDAKARQGWNRIPEAGQSAPNLLHSLTGGLTGGLTGAAVGTHLGGPTGGVLGGAAGFITGFTVPMALESPRVKAAMSRVGSFIKNAGVSPRAWFNGTPQVNMSNVDLAMDRIMREQEMHTNAAKGPTYLERVRKLPAEIAKGLDPYSVVQDQKQMGAISRMLWGGQKEGRVWRTTSPNTDASLYYAMKDARGKAQGLRDNQLVLYEHAIADSAKDGLKKVIPQWGNYLAYKRTFEVLQEHGNELASKIGKTQQALRDPNNGIEATLALRDKLQDLTKMQKELQDKVASGKAVPGGYTPKSLQDAMHRFRDKLGVNNGAKLDGYMSRIFEARSGILSFLKDGIPGMGIRGGIISQEAFDNYTRRGPEYVPMERMMDDLEKNKFHSAVMPLDLKHQTIVQKMEGSERTNVPFWEAMTHADSKAFNQLLRNNTMGLAVEQAQAHPDTIGAEFKPVKPGYRAKAGETILGHYVDGKPQLYAVPSYLGDVMQRYPEAAKSAFTVFGHAWKASATALNLGWQAAALVTHAQAGFTYAESNKNIVNYVKAWTKSVRSVLAQDEPWREAVRSGATAGTFQSQITPELLAGPEDLGVSKSWYKRSPLETMARTAQKLEEVNRVATFRNARQAGGNLAQAAHEAKYFGGTPDYSRMGDMSQPLNQMFMFANARAQYFTQMGQAIRRNPMRVAGVAIAITAADIALQSWNVQQKDKDGNSLIRKVSADERERNWVVLTPWTHMVNGVERAYELPVPKYLLGRMLNPVEEAVIRYAGAEDRTGTQVALDYFGHMAPVSMNLDENKLGSSVATSVVGALHPVVKTAMEQFANRGDFGSPIVPESQQGLSPQYQVGPNTSAAAKAMGEGGWRGAAAGGATLGAAAGLMFGAPGAAAGFTAGAAIGGAGIISPRRVDAGMRSMTAGAASQTTSYLNPFFEGAQTTKVSAWDVARNAPVVGPLISRFTGGTGDQQANELTRQFYDRVGSASEPLKNMREMEKTDPIGAAQYFQKNQNNIGIGIIAERAQKRMAHFSQVEQHIKQDPSLTDSQRDEQLKNVYNVKINALKSFIELMKPSPASPTYANPGQGMGNAR